MPFEEKKERMNYQPILKELEELTVDTFGLWDHNRVGFQWRRAL